VEEDDRHHSIAKDEAGWADLPPSAIAEAKAFRDKTAAAGGYQSTASKSNANGSESKQQEIFPKLTPAKLSEMLDSKLILERERREHPSSSQGDEANESGVQLLPGRVEYVSSFRAQTGKRIAVPVRVEPKVYYANERTSPSPCLWVRELS
jgi:hypothetical protein